MFDYGAQLAPLFDLFLYKTIGDWEWEKIKNNMLGWKERQTKEKYELIKLFTAVFSGV